MQGIQTLDGCMSSIVAAANRFAARFAMRGICEAEDIAQSALLKVLARKDESPPTTGWLYQVVRNTAYDAGRKYAAQSRYLSHFDDAGMNASVCELADENAQVCLAGRQNQPMENSEYDLAILSEMLKNLAPKLRQVLTLYAEGMSYQEIAIMTGANIGTVRSRLHYARRQARRLLDTMG